jgi:hypothetical protein
MPAKASRVSPSKTPQDASRLWPLGVSTAFMIRSPRMTAAAVTNALESEAPVSS